MEIALIVILCVAWFFIGLSVGKWLQGLIDKM